MNIFSIFIENRLASLIHRILCIRGFESRLNQNKITTTQVVFLFWLGWRDSVTFGDPETSRLQTQFASEGFLATRRLAGLTPECFTSEVSNTINLQVIKIKPTMKVSFIFMAGMEGFEPPNAWTKTMCLTTWRHPNKD